MNTNEIRLKNTQYLVDTKCKGIKAVFARKINKDPQGISRWWAEKTEQRRNISSKSARLIEESFDLSEGWLDVPHFDQVGDEKATYTANVMHRIPIKGTAQLGDDGYWEHIDSNDADGFINIPTDDPQAYSLQLRGDSMRPAIKSGWYAVCEPGREPVLGEFVHVVAKDGRSMVKELLIYNQNQIVLDSVNEDHKRITFAPDEIDKIHYAFIVPPSKHSL